MKEKWYLQTKKADFKRISEKFHISPITARLIRNRDIISDEDIEEYLRGGIENLHSPWLLKDMDKGVHILKIKISQQNKIRIICDYDVDGICSGFILHQSLKKLGAVVDVVVPHRIEDGYGINERLIRQAYEDGVDTILTCDNGIAAISQVEYAKSLGMTVIVTDHHQVVYNEEDGEKKYVLPQADAVINHKQADCPYHFKELCGAMVAYQLISALSESMEQSQNFVREFLPYAAMATVCDVVDLRGENRIVVKAGIEAFKYNHHIGINALIEACQLDKKKLDAYHFGFILGPCLNASGRLDTAMRSLSLLQCEDEEEAAKLANDLKALNDSRKALTEQGTEAAYKLINGSDLKNDRVMVVFLPDCHESLAGIIAGRIREKYHKPAFVLTRGEKSVKGSGRSTENYSMYEELVKCDSLLLQYGGHPMAAGLSIEEANVEAFRRQLNENCTLTEEDMIPKIVIDVPMPISYINENLIRQLSVLEPFGKGNAKPVFAQKNLRVLKTGIYGKTQNTVKLQLMDESGTVMDGVYWGEAKEFAEFARSHGTISVTYYPKINSYMGRDSLQIVIQNYC